MSTIVLATSGWTGWPDYAGSTWVPLQWLLGLRQLGAQAWWVDHLPRIDPYEHAHSLPYLLERVAATAEAFGFPESYVVVCDGAVHPAGATAARPSELAAAADLLIALSGTGLPDDSPLLDIRRRAYVDVDPGFTQIWAHQARMRFDQFQTFFTVGQNVGRPQFPIPTRGIEWHPILPPVVLEQWPAHIDEHCRRFSTVADWWGRQHVRFNGEYYGTKREEFLKFLRLPELARRPIELALSIYQQDARELAMLHEHGWRVLDPFRYAGDPQAYREFIRYSRAEFSVAKGGYVKCRSGWVSDRTACYLASGKPAVVQSTGFEDVLPVGEGLVTFRTPEEAAAGILAVDRDYRAHAEAARGLAERHFASDVVLPGVLERAGL